MTRAYAFLGFLLMLGGCAGGLRELDLAKQHEGANDLAAIEGMPIPTLCANGSPSPQCAQFMGIRGRACMALARSSTPSALACPADGPQVKQRLSCAIDALGRIGTDPNAIEPQQREDYLETRGQALFCAGMLEAAPTAVPLIRQSQAVLAGIPVTPRRDWLQANTQNYLALHENLPAEERCKLAQHAFVLAGRGLKSTPDAALTGALNAAANDAHSIAATLPNCQL